jgi:hypothetical protein
MPRECCAGKNDAITVLAPLTYDRFGHLMRGMQKNHPIQDIIELWPSRQVLADDLGLKVVVVHRWHKREGIPAVYDLRLLDAACRRNIPLLWRDLMVARTVPKTSVKQAPDQDGHNLELLQGAKDASL